MEEETSEEQWKMVKQRSGTSIRRSLIWRVGKKIAVTGIVITSAPFVLPPLIVGSSIGFALSLPFGMLFVGYACTQKVMSMLLSGLQVERIREGEREVEEEEEEEEFEEDVKRRLEMRIEEEESTVEDVKGGAEETGYERIAVEEPVSGVHDEEEVESLHGHGDVKGSVEDEKMDEGIVVEEPARGVDEQETRNQQGSGMTRVSEERMEDKDENVERGGYEEDYNVKEGDKSRDMEEIVEDKSDKGIVAEEPVSGVHNEDEVESLHGHGDVKGFVEDEKMDEGIVVEEPARGVDEQETRHQQGSDMTRVSEERMEDKDENAERGGYEEDYNVKEGDKSSDMEEIAEDKGDDIGIVAEEPVSGVHGEDEVESLHGHGDVKGFVEEPARGVDEQETRNQQGSDITRVSEERMEDKDENAERGGYAEDYNVNEDDKSAGMEEIVEDKGDERVIAEEEVKREEEIVANEPHDEQAENQLGGGIARRSGEEMDDRDESIGKRRFKEDHNVEDDRTPEVNGLVNEEVKSDEGIVAEEPVSENKDEQDMEQLGVGVARSSEKERGRHTDDVKEDDKLVGTKGVVEEEKRDEGIVDDEHDEITNKSGLNKDYNDKDYDRLPNAKEKTKLGIVVGGALGGGENKQNVENPLVTRDSENADEVIEGKEDYDVKKDEKFVEAKKRKKYQKKKDKKKKRREEGSAVGVTDDETKPRGDSLGGEEETELDLSLGEPKGKEEAPMEERDVFVEGSANEAEDRIQGNENGYKENGIGDGKPAHAQMDDSTVVKDHQVSKEIPIMEVREENPSEVADESGLDLLDEQTPTSEQYKSETDETCEDKAPQAYVSRPVDIDDESQHESTAVSSITEEHGSDVGEESVDSVGVASKEVAYREEKIWGQIDSMRKILGCKGEKQATFYEEIRALYVFTGVEPPAAFEDPVDLVEVDDKLRLLMAIVGVK